MKKEQKQKKGLSKRAKILMGVLIPVGAIGVAAGITLPLVLNKKPSEDQGTEFEMTYSEQQIGGYAYPAYWIGNAESVNFKKGKKYKFTCALTESTYKVAGMTIADMSGSGTTVVDQNTMTFTHNGTDVDFRYSASDNAEYLTLEGEEASKSTGTLVVTFTALNDGTSTPFMSKGI